MSVAINRVEISVKILILQEVDLNLKESNEL